MVADFMRYYTGTKISHFSRFHEISNSNLNISWLQFSWDITLCSQYLIVDDFMRYYNRTKISHVCRFHEIFHRNLNISWLHISRLRFRLAHHRTALRYFCCYVRIVEQDFVFCFVWGLGLKPNCWAAKLQTLCGLY